MGPVTPHPPLVTTVEVGILRRVGPRHLTPGTTLYDVSYIPDTLYDTVQRVVQCSQVVSHLSAK